MPLSPDPQAKANQLANLKRGGTPPAPALGNTRTLRHGGWASIERGRLNAKVQELTDSFAEDAPLRDIDGGLPRHDRLAIVLLATAWCRLENVEDYLERHGTETEGGELRSAALDREGQLRKEIAGYLQSLGMTPASRVAIGVDLVKTAPDKGSAMSAAARETDLVLRHAALKEAGLAGDEDNPNERNTDA